MSHWLSAPPAPPVAGDDSKAATAAAVENSSGEKIFHNILLMSYKYNDNNNLMLAAVISLLLVVLVVFLLHVYARCFFVYPSRHLVAADHVLIVGLPPAALPQNKGKGLARSDIASSIPHFVYEEKGKQEGGECVICLSSFEDGDLGRKLPKCSHAFHADCIDMWLFSHASCPVCRAPVVAGGQPEYDGGGGGAAAASVVPP